MPVTMPNDADFMANATARMMAAVVADNTAEGLGVTEDAAATDEGKGGAVETPPPAAKADTATSSPGKAAAAPSKATAKGAATPARGPDGKFLPGAGGQGGATSKATPAGKAEAQPAATEATEQAEPAQVDLASTDDPVAKLERLKGLAKELGFTVDEARVSTAERYQLRKERREQTNKIAQLEQQAQARAEKILSETSVKASVALQAQRAIEAGDYDAFAKALGRADWNALNTEVIARFADPNYKRMRELESWKTQQEEQAQRARAEAEARAKQDEESRVVTSYKADLSAQMAQSADPLIAAFADDPSFVQAIFDVQKNEYDGYNTVTPEEAIRLRPNEGGSPLLDHMRQLYSRLEKAFRAGQIVHETTQVVAPQAAPPKPEPAAAQAAAGSNRDASVPVRQSKPTTSIPQRKATEAAAPAKFKDDRSFMKYAEQRMLEAIAKDQ